MSKMMRVSRVIVKYKNRSAGGGRTARDIVGAELELETGERVPVLMSGADQIVSAEGVVTKVTLFCHTDWELAEE